MSAEEENNWDVIFYLDSEIDCTESLKSWELIGSYDSYRKAACYRDILNFIGDLGSEAGTFRGYIVFHVAYKHGNVYFNPELEDLPPVLFDKIYENDATSYKLSKDVKTVKYSTYSLPNGLGCSENLLRFADNLMGVELECDNAREVAKDIVCRIHKHIPAYRLYPELVDIVEQIEGGYESEEEEEKEEKEEKKRKKRKIRASSETGYY